ncbi:MAG: hypothetical protein GY811_29975 [Myxococcales bacterium]|nr:hypothetical protein [Myxococcales bacterium]
MGPAKALALIATAAVLGGSCDKDKAPQQRLTRNGDQPAVIIVGAPRNTANSIAEVEPNHEVSAAQALVEGSSVRGVLDGSEDIDRYSFVAAESGLLFAEVSGGGAADLTLSVANSSGAVLAKSDRGPAGTSEGLPGFGVESGTSYQIVVSEFVGRKLRKAGGRKEPSAEYVMSWRVSIDAEEGFEREPNTEVSGAVQILTGEEGRGFVGWSGDLDLWRMPAPGSGEVVAASQRASKEALHIVLSGLPGVSTELSLLSADGRVIATRRASKGQEVAIRNFLPAVAANSYLLRVGGKPSNPDEHYALRIDAVEIDPGTEEEPNDTLALATPLGGDDSTLLLARGEVTRGDVDTFRLSPVNYDRILELRLSGPSDADLDIAVVAESGAIVIESLSEGSGVSEALSQVPVGAGQSPFIRVSPKTVEGPAEYELSLSLIRGTAPPIAPPIDITPAAE